MAEDQQQIGRHWSKDFVEHLRMVHFALIAVCIAVIIVAVARIQSEVSRAHEQLRQIMDLTTRWDDFVLGDHPRIRRYKVEIQLHGENFYMLVHPPAFVLFAQDKPITKGGKPDIPKPSSIAGFAEAWDLLNGGVLVINMEKPAKCTLGRDSPEAEIPCTWRAETSDSGQDQWHDIGSIGLNSKDEKELRKNGSIDIKQTYLLDLSEKPDGTPDHPFFLTVHLEAKPVDLLGALIARFPQWQWHRGAFKDAFRALASVSSEYTAIDFEKAERILDAEEKRSGESVDAFGLKFPAELAIRWGAGAALILIVQLYMWAHLFEFRRKLSSTDEGWNVAWVGVYETVPARILLYGSLFIFPTAGILTVGIRGLYIADFDLHSWFLLTGSTLITLLMSILICISLPKRTEIIAEDPKSAAAAG